MFKLVQKRFAVIFVFGMLMVVQPILAIQPQPQDYDMGREAVVAYLEAQKNGETDLARFFCASRDATQFFNVQEYTILDSECDTFECKFFIRIKATDKGGRVIVNTWKICARTRSQGTCISSIEKSN